MNLWMEFTQLEQPDIDIKAPLIYLWKISSAAGEVVGWYVGKAEGGAKRPTQDYVYNVNRLLQKKAYRTQGRDYRRVHEAMADAVCAGYVISLRYLCNVSPGEDIYAVEQRYIREYGCTDNGICLNAQRQHGERPKASTTKTTEMSVMNMTPDIAEETQQDKCGLESFRQLIATHFPQLISKARATRCAFSTHDKVRIVRAKQETPGGRVNIKLALTSRREDDDRTFNWDGTPAQVLNAVEGELHLYEKYFKKA
jgi:hypothetical protein